MRHSTFGCTPLWSLLIAAAFLGSAPAGAATARWQQVGAPSRQDYGAVIDPIRNRLIVFGGQHGGRSGSNAVDRNDVFALSLDGLPIWTQLWPQGTPPSPRIGASAIYDPLRDRMLIYGGETGGVSVKDLWALSMDDPPTWTLLSANQGPPYGLKQHSAIYDPVADRMLVFGGEESVPPQGYPYSSNKVWQVSFNPVQWTQLFPSGTPPIVRSAHVAIYDAPRDRMVVFGGWTLGSAPSYPTFSDVWALSLRPTLTWTRLNDGTGGPPRGEAVAFHDPSHDQLIVFGGYAYGDSPIDSGTWAFDLTTNTWSSVPTGALAPPARGSASLLYDAPRNRAILYGGGDSLRLFSEPPRSDVWALTDSAGQMRWNRVLPRDHDIPRARYGHSLILDDVRDRLVMFGGGYQSLWTFPPYSQYSDQFNDAWTLDLAAPWQGWVPLLTGPAPTPRVHQSTIYDPARRRMLIHGGQTGQGANFIVFTDTWQLTLDPPVEWSEIETGDGVFRTAQGAILDPVSDRMLMFGGYDGVSLHNDVQELPLEGGVWTPLAVTGTPPSPREAASIVYDPVRHRMLVYGGEESGGEAPSAVFALTLGATPTWSQLATAGPSPPPIQRAGAIYDPVGDRMVIYASKEFSDSAWALSLSGTPTWSVVGTTGAPPGWHTLVPAVYDARRQRMVLFGSSYVLNSSKGGHDTWALAFDAAAAVDVPVAASSPALDLKFRRNPSAGALVVSLTRPDDRPVTLEVFDIAGRRQVTRTVSGPAAASQWLDLGRFRPGVYVARLSGPHGSISRRAVVIGGS